MPHSVGILKCASGGSNACFTDPVISCLASLGGRNGSKVWEDVCWLSEVGVCEEGSRMNKEVDLQSGVVGSA